MEDKGRVSVRGLRIGGVSLYNENYSRNLEDKRVLEQIQMERDLRIRQKKHDLVHSIVMQDLLQAEEEKKEKVDEVAEYILQSKKKKDSIYSVTSYEPELRNIMDFFHNAQSDAKEFLAKKGRIDKRSSEVHFSFSDFEREVQGRQSEFKKEVLQKMKDFIEKMKVREK